MRHAGRKKWSLVIFLGLLLFALSLTPYGSSPTALAEFSTSTGSQVVKELTALRTENSKTFLLSDGTRRCEIYSGPIQFKDETGAWQEIDTSLLFLWGQLRLCGHAHEGDALSPSGCRPARLP